MRCIRKRPLVFAATAGTVIALSLSGIAPVHAAAPTRACSFAYGGNIVSYAMTCSEPGEPMYGGFATWRNVPIGFDQVDTRNRTVLASVYLRVTPNTEESPVAQNIEIGLYAEKTGRTTKTYGPKWWELGKRGGRVTAIKAGVDPNKPDRRNHTYMALRKSTGNQWDVLYDFNSVGSTTEQLKVVPGSTNRIDTGLHLMGHEYMDVPEIADRLRFMDGNNTWRRVKNENTAKVVSLPQCSATKKPPNCFKTRLSTDGAVFNQWTVSKPRRATPAKAAAHDARPQTPLGPKAQPAQFNGVDQTALQNCLVEDADSCLATVPGLAECVRTTRVCNAAALETDATSAEPDAEVDSASIKERAATAFDVDPQQISVGAPNPAKQVPAAFTDHSLLAVTSSAATPGLRPNGQSYEGFQATYSRTSGDLIEACWGDMCGA